MGFRKWLDAHGGQPQWATGVSPALPPQEPRREVLLDRYESHTKHCSSCSTVRRVPAACHALGPRKFYCGSRSGVFAAHAATVLLPRKHTAVHQAKPYATLFHGEDLSLLGLGNNSIFDA